MTTLLSCSHVTPLVRLQRIPKRGRVLLKMESQSISRSVKDQVVRRVLRRMIKENVITKDSHLYEACTGSLGVSLAMCCAALNIPFTCVMDQSVSFERRLLIKAYGAELVITPGYLGLRGAIDKASQLASGANSVVFGYYTRQECNDVFCSIIESYLPRYLKHYNINPRFFVCGSGTGNSISAYGKVLKRHFPQIRIILVEPATSQVVTGRPAGIHGIQGIGPGFVPPTLDLSVVDGVESVTTGVAMQYTKWLASMEGIMAGISTAANVAVAQRYAEYYNCDVLTLAFDTGERYLGVDGIFDGYVFYEKAETSGGGVRCCLHELSE